MPYIPDLNQTQLGTESLFGTAVVGSVKLALIDKCTITPEVGIDTLPDERGSLAPGYVDVVSKHSGKAKITGIATYQDLPYYQDSIFGLAAATGPTNFVRPYAGPLTTVQTRRMLTVLHGQTGMVAKLTSGVVDELSLSCEKNGNVKFDASFLGKQVSDGALAALSDRAQDPIRGADMKLFMDPWGGVVGATEITGLVWFSWNLNIKSNVAMSPSIGSIYPVNYREASWKVTLKTKLELNATGAALITAYLGTSVAQRQVRIKATTGVGAIAQWDVAGTVKKIGDMFTDTDGIASIEFELSGLYNTALANSIASSITNMIAVMP